jgi:type IV pilus assembly protein PilC
MAALLGAGIPILQSLATMRRHAPHPALRDASADIDLSVRGGKRLSEAMQDAKVFPALLVRLVAAGALSGGRITVTAHGASLALPAILAGTRAWMDSR